MSKINWCPLCGSWLNYDSYVHQWYCSGECDYTESEKPWKHINEFKEVKDE